MNANQLHQREGESVAWMVVEHGLALKYANEHKLQARCTLVVVYLMGCRYLNYSRIINAMFINFGCIKILLTRAYRRVLGHKTLEKCHLHKPTNM